jgi:predicted nucleic acid-binding protein
MTPNDFLGGSAGLVDTNTFFHAQTHDVHSDECRRFLAALERGDVQAVLDPIVLHELSFVLPRYVKQMSRHDVATYLEVVLSWPGIQGDKGTMIDAVQRWRDTPGLAFADAYLAARAAAESRPVYTKNVRELRGQAVAVPDPLPAG